MNNHPQIAELYKIYKSESQPFRKVHRMIDLFESIIKSHTVLIMTEYVKYNKLSDAAKGLLAQGLRTPSLGTWQLFSRVLFEELEKDNYPWLLPDFAGEFVTLDKALNVEKTNVIAFRNGYAHGATPIDAQCEADIKKFEPFLTQLLESKWLNTSSLEVRDNKVYLVCKAGELTLHPMLLYRKEDAESSFAFFNDLKNDKIGLLNYPLSKHYREKDFFTEFHEHLPLNDWKKTGNNEFYQRIEELTETFKGRTIEREKLLQFVLHNHKGYFSIQGNPGIGKSALIAQFFKDLRSHAEVKKLKVIEYFIRRGTQQAQVEYMFNYLIRRTDEVFPAGKEIRAEGKIVFDLQSQLFAKWRLWGEQANGQQLLFLIDGLDEGVENNVVTYLPRENFDNILIIYGSRPGGHKTIDDLWATLPVENHSKLELSGLGKEDIRALIYEVANKYEVERESAWIDAVQKRSQGNPLYLKLLCDAIENGSIELNDINALPEKIDEYYKAILQRYAQDTVDGDALLAGLFTFAAAKDYLSMAHLGLINKLGSATVQRIGSTLKEVLYENPLTEEVLDYQLFHESFREYFVKEKAKEVSDAAGRIIDFCNTWQELEGSWEQRYPLEHYASHLAESKKADCSAQLVALAEDPDYIQTQKQVLKQYTATQKLYRLVLEQAIATKDYEIQLQAALHLIDVHYEEQNDTPQIVALVATGNPEDLDLALKRIESFGGADKEGVRRRFILYMLCLMELTLLDSKDKPFCKPAIEKLLNHLDEQIPPDTSLINWNSFFPSYLMFLMACEWADIELDYLMVYKRTDYWDVSWISEKGPYSDLQIEVLLECVRGIIDNRNKFRALVAISPELDKHGKTEEAASTMQESYEIARDISSKHGLLLIISSELFKQGKTEEAASIMQESLECARGISEDLKWYELETLSIELIKQGKTEESLEIARGISYYEKRCKALAAISTELTKQGQILKAASIVQDSLEIARGITDYEERCIALVAISRELFKQGKSEEAAFTIQESFEMARNISNNGNKGQVYFLISYELAIQGKLDESFEIVHGLDSNLTTHFSTISMELAEQGLYKEADRVMQESIEMARNISNNWTKGQAFSVISGVLAEQGKLENSLEIAQGISDARVKIQAFEIISNELIKQGLYKEAAQVMQEFLELARGINRLFIMDETFMTISGELAKQGKLEESLEIARGIDSLDYMYCTFESISVELAKQGKLEKSLEITRGISDNFEKGKAMAAISTELAKQDKLEESIEIARGISYYEIRCKALAAISTELTKQGKTEKATSIIQESLKCALDISDGYYMSKTMVAISTELAKQGKLEESLAIARGISVDRYKSIAIFTISVELAKQGMLEESLEIARGISDDDSDKSIAMVAISNELAKQGKTEEASSTMQESIECARGISNDWEKYQAYMRISCELAKQGNWVLTEITVMELAHLEKRHNCWMELGKIIDSLQQFNQLQSDEARLFYLKGWVENVSVNNATIELVTTALPYFVNDTESIEKILQQHALHEVVFNTAPIEKIKQLNSTLNIQWFLDIYNSTPQPPTAKRLSTNLVTWLREIEDEDDQEQVMLWAKQLAKGKITEEEFQVKINTL